MKRSSTSIIFQAIARALFIAVTAVFLAIALAVILIVLPVSELTNSGASQKGSTWSPGLGFDEKKRLQVEIRILEDMLSVRRERLG